MDGRQHRDRLLRHVDARKDARGFGDSGQPFVKHLGRDMLQMQHDVIGILAGPAPFVDLNRHRAADDIAGRQILGVRRIALHEALTRSIGQIPAFAACAFRDQTAGTENAGRVELGEFHVLQRQARAQRHGIAVAGAGVRRGAGEIGPTIAAGRQHGLMRAEAVQSAVLHAQGQHAAAGPFFVDDQIDREIFDIELGLMLQALLIQRVQNRMAGAIGRSTGTFGHGTAILHGMAPERALIDLAVFGSRERNAEMLQLDDGRDRIAAHVFDRVLVTEPVGPFDGVVHVKAPVILTHVGKGCTNATLGGNRVAAGRKNLGNTGCLQTGGDHPQRRAQASATSPDDHDIIAVIDNLVAFRHVTLQPRYARLRPLTQAPARGPTRAPARY